MADNVNFDKLASSLPMDERKNLLEKLKGQSNISQEPLYYSENVPDVSLSIEEEYLRLPWYFRLWYSILGLFRSKVPIKIYEDRLVASLGQKIDELSPGLYDYHNGILLPAFYSQLVNLKAASRFFYTALDAGFNKDKGAFYSFLSSLEMASIHSQLQTAANPALAEAQNPGIQETELRIMALRSMDEALKEISDESRGVMYYDARSLFCLKELSSFLFDRLLVTFTYDSALGGYTCTANTVKDMLSSLNNILFSLKNIPPMPLLESLFVFLLQERAGEPGFDINKEIHGLLISAEEALAVIRNFNKQVSLTRILRCAGRNNHVRPQEISGGEDWFLVYREYWKRQIEDRFSDYARERRRQGLLDSFSYFLNGTNLKAMDNTASDSNPEGFPLKGAFNLSFLLSFYRAVFIGDINKTLKLILIDGEFTRKENRIEFNESYNGLISMEDKIRKLESEISPSGDYGKRYAQARQDMSSLAVKRRKIQIVTDEASAEAAAILEETRRSCRDMICVLEGISGKDSRGRFFPLINLSDLSEKTGEFIAGVNDAAQKLQRALEILDDIDTLETGR